MPKCLVKIFAFQLLLVLVSIAGGQEPILDTIACSESSYVQIASQEYSDIPSETLVGSDLPHYDWYYGCTPTSTAMMVSYWDSKAGYGNLLAGDTTSASYMRSVIASDAHTVSGSENGYTYGDWHNSISYPDHEANPDSIADFLKTVDSGTMAADISVGLENYVGWDNPDTAVNESYQADAALVLDSYYSGGEFSYGLLQDEINADRPVMLNVLTAIDGGVSGHSIVCYGYQDDMFELVAAGSTETISVAGIAIDDTWSQGSTSQAQWLYDEDGNGVVDHYLTSAIDEYGVEWWPLLTLDASDGRSYSNYWDWTFSNMVTLDIESAEVPEPTSIVLAGLSLLMVRFSSKRKRG